MRYLLSKVIYNKQISSSYYKIGLLCNELPVLSSPGQFVMVKVSPQADPFLGRPFSIYSTMKDRQGIEILYKVVGKGTTILSDKRTADAVHLVGPLGNGFSIDENCKDIILVAGGIGIAPFFYLTEWIKERGATLIVGGKVKDDIVCTEEFQEMNVAVKIVTEDGSLGRRGLVTDMLKEELREREGYPSVIYACGPIAMLTEVAAIAKRRDTPCQVSLDRIMACGIGTCLGCVVKTEDKNCKEDIKNKGWTYKRVCKEGPVFDAREIIWEER
ncbi:MAG: dihydroorotate dehydrogenase electron transfer subunit [Thermodesulfobacteriota bacterium]